ncbi:MAG: DUF465 domain-containing protein [Alphaproteobacteria bacterium]|nr:DUF465 domain-containing protein [Alphaproteobacteria bacterium]
MTQHHDLASEFPDMKREIHELKITDAHFRKLFDGYEDVSKELHRVFDGAGSISDVHAEDLKKKRAALKDDLYLMLKMKQASEGGCQEKACC